MKTWITNLSRCEVTFLSAIWDVSSHQEHCSSHSLIVGWSVADLLQDHARVVVLGVPSCSEEHEGVRALGKGEVVQLVGEEVVGL